MNILVLLIALLEGFTTLAVQIIGIRAAVPIAGSSIILTSVYIGIILMALSVGYYFGGVIASKRPKKKLPLLLAGYLFIAGIYYGLITFGIHEWLLESLLNTTGSYIFTLFIVGLALFFLPVVIAAQTIPLLTEISSFTSKGRAAGSMLFWSTIGSFLGSVGTSIVLFQYLGVVWTSILIVIMMFFCTMCSLIVYKKSWAVGAIIGFIIASSSIIILGNTRVPTGNFTYNSAYQEIVVRDAVINDRPGKVFHTNGAYASAIFNDTKTSPFNYIREAVSITRQVAPKNILVIGTAGFTYPHEISQLSSVQQIDAVDIDPSVKWIAEKHFLQTKLSDKITFYPQPARYFVDQAVTNNKKYDLIFVDAFNGKHLPNELVTYKFYEQLNQLADREDIVFNMILDNPLDSDLAENVLTTLGTARGQTPFAKNVSGYPNAPIVNYLITGKPFDASYKPVPQSGTVYTDNKRSSELDMIAFLIEEHRLLQQ